MQRGRRRGSTKIKINRVLLDAEAGYFDELLSLVGQSFKDDCYYPSMGKEQRE
jgi:hypothetical protein